MSKTLLTYGDGFILKLYRDILKQLGTPSLKSDKPLLELRNKLNNLISSKPRTKEIPEVRYYINDKGNLIIEKNSLRMYYTQDYFNQLLNTNKTSKEYDKKRLEQRIEN